MLHKGFFQLDYENTFQWSMAKEEIVYNVWTRGKKGPIIFL